MTCPKLFKLIVTKLRFVVLFCSWVQLLVEDPLSRKACFRALLTMCHLSCTGKAVSFWLSFSRHWWTDSELFTASYCVWQLFSFHPSVAFGELARVLPEGFCLRLQWSFARRYSMPVYMLFGRCWALIISWFSLLQHCSIYHHLQMF